MPSRELAATSKRSLVARGMIRALRGYQYVTAGRVSACRYYPSCSHYAAESLEVHGAIRGSALAIRRVARCNPFASHGIDLVPPNRTASTR